MEVLQTVESKYGEINVLKVREQTSVYASGRLLFSYPDPPTDEMSSHLPMTLHPSPAKILLIGGSPGTIREFLKYPVEEIDFIELDPKIIVVSQGLFDRAGRHTCAERPEIADNSRRRQTVYKSIERTDI